MFLVAGCGGGPPAAASPAPTRIPFPAVAGEYRTSDGDAYVVNGVGHLVRLDDGWIRQLYPSPSPSRFTFGPSFEVGTPARGDVQFHLAAGRADSLALGAAGNPRVSADRVLFKETDVQFKAADGVTLAGTITEPSTTGPHPAIVVIHGSEPGTRVLYGVWAGLYAGLGFTVLIYDKRGNGESGGVFPGDNSEPSSLNTFAGDAASAARFLAAWPGVDPRRVGFHGGSQGGWTVPLAIQRFRSAAFAVLLSGPAVSVGQQTVWSLASGDASYIPTEPAEQIDSEMRRAAGVGYQPGPALRTLTQPVLWLNGANDRRVPTALTDEILLGMHKPNFVVGVLPGVGHGLLENATGLDAEDANADHLAPELFTRMAAWLASIAGTSPRP